MTASEEAGRSDEVTHLCPLAGGGIMPCCGLTPSEVPRWHRLTLDPAQVTCKGKERETQDA